MSRFADQSPIRRRANQLQTTDNRQKIVSQVKPEKPFSGQRWTDLSVTPAVVREWRADLYEWVVVNPDGTLDDNTAPAVPTNLTATAGTESIKLEWDANTESDFSHYEVWQHTSDASGSATKIADLMQMDYLTITGLTVGTALYYWLKSVDYSGNKSAFTASVNATPTALPPASASLSLQGWTNSITFSATDYRVVAWAGGDLVLSDGTTYSITGANTGNMSALTYIYLDTGTSTTAFQTSTTSTDSVGANKILVAVAQDNSDTTSYASYQVFGGEGGVTLFVDNIAANSASTNEFISNTAQIKDAMIIEAKIDNLAVTTGKINNLAVTTGKIDNLAVTDAKIDTLGVNKLTAGSITSKAITLAMSEGTGDCYMAMGTVDTSAWTATNGILFGLDDSDSNREKMYCGNATSYWDWNVTTADKVTITDANISGTLSVGTIPSLPDDTNLVGAWSLNEGSGITAIDSTINGNNGTHAGDPTFAQGVSGTCLDFDGTGDYVDCSTGTGTALGDGVTDISVSLWFQADTVAAGGKGLFNFGSFSSAQGELSLIIDNSILRFRMFNAAFNQSTAFTDTTSFHHLVATYDGTTGRLYLDTELVIEQAHSDVLDLSGLKTIIGGYFSTAGVFNGKIGNVRVYDKAITLNQVKALYTNQSGTISEGVKQTGGAYTSATSGARMYFNATDGLNVIDSSSDNVLKAEVSGADEGDLTIGNYDGDQGIKYDKSADNTDFKGTVSGIATLPVLALEYGENLTKGEALSTIDSDATSATHIECTDDTYVDINNATTNYDGTTPLHLSGSGRPTPNLQILLKFDSGLPADFVKFISFDINFTVISTIAGQSIDVSAVTSAFTSSTVTWNTKPTLTDLNVQTAISGTGLKTINVDGTETYANSDNICNNGISLIATAAGEYTIDSLETVSGTPIYLDNLVYLARDGKIHKSTAVYVESTNEFVGFCSITANSGATDKPIIYTGLLTTSGLAAGSTCYLADTKGTIATSAGTNSKKVGRAVSTTAINIKNDND